ncbi:MAG TPA: glycosyltransferase N-terminal domain-containing protein, partial [Arachidicoccus sp.]
MSIAFYRLFLFLYSIGIKVASLFNKKARLWLEGRKNILNKLSASFKENTSPVIWFHCASLGEFEQGRTLLEQLREDYPSHKILLTFFSPSGYEVHKQYNSADYVFYLPLDGIKNAKKFISIAHPELIVFVKYEFWYFYLSEIKKQGIALLLVSSIFRDEQPFFKWYGSLHRKMLRCFTQIFVQDYSSKNLLDSINIKDATICGDTRVDRVLEISDNWKPVDKIEGFCSTNKVIACGSTWEEDDEELNHYVNK